MSKVSEVKKIILDLLKDQEVHTIGEIIQCALERNVITDEKDMAVSNAIYQMKKSDPDFVSIGRGKYQMNNPDKCTGTSEIDEHLEYILKEIEEIKSFDWLNCRDEELFAEREKVSKIKKVVVEFQKVIKK